MKIFRMCCLFVLTLSCGVVLAQEQMVSGRISFSEDKSALPGVNVILKGTSNGTTTDANGDYKIAVPNGGTLVFSFIGLVSQEIAVGERSIIDIQMASDVTQLTELVVTAQGIERDQRTLGYSVQAISGAQIQQRSEPNVLNSLQGKVAGVNIVGASGLPGASTNINIRGITSFTGSNQPLVVVDGIIFSNQVDNGPNSTVFGTQPSNRLADVNPDNIESLTVLKGPAASILYGSRASAGAIVITTKSGKGMSDKTSVTISSSYNVQNVYGLPKYQNDYGQGTNNDFVNTAGNSYGPKFGTGGITEVTTRQGDVVPYKAFPNNEKDWFKQGSILQNTISIASGKGDNNYILSIGNLDQKGIINNTSFGRTNIQLGGNAKLTNGLKVSSTITYSLTTQRGQPQGNGGSAVGNITRIPRSYDLNGRPYEDVFGTSIYFSTTQNHPTWSTVHETNDSRVDRIFGNFSLGYDITPWLSATYRVTADVFTNNSVARSAIGSNRQPTGQVIQDQVFRSELNGDLLINAKKENIFMQGLNANLLLGQNTNQRYQYNPTYTSTTLNLQGFFDPSNATTFNYAGGGTTKQRLLGYYGQLSLGYKDYLFVEFSGRVDQSSTLPKNNNTYFYPGVNVALVLSEALNIKSDLLSYVKIKANMAKVGRDAPPYQLQSVFVASGFGNNVASVTYPINVGGAAVAGFSPSTRVGNPALRPEFVTSMEAGINVGLLQNRVGFDVNYFSTESTSQIFNASMSPSTGYDTRTINVGKLTNKGWEVVLSATPVKTSAFKWDLALNFTSIRNNVESITDGVTSSQIPGGAFVGITPSIRVGEPYGVIVSTALTRNADGQLLVNPVTGLYVTGTPNTVISNPQPDWLAGLNNTFSYKGVSLSVLVDTRQGGSIFSFGITDLKNNGGLAITGINREMPRVLPGVIGTGAVDASTGLNTAPFVPNNIQIPAQTYWGALGGLGSEASAYNATVYRLREVSLGYKLPQKWYGSTFIGDIFISVSGRNLFYYAPYFPADPEVNTQGAGNIQGLDISGAPNVRNYGVNVRLTF